MMMLEPKERWWIKEAIKLGYTLAEEERRRLYEAPKRPVDAWEIQSED